MCYDMSKPTEPPKEMMACPGALAMSWTHWNGVDYPGDTLVMFGRNAQRILYNPTTGKSSTTVFEKPSEPIVIQSITLGPDNKIWTGGYLSGGNASYDPATGKSEEHK